MNGVPQMNRREALAQLARISAGAGTVGAMGTAARAARSASSAERNRPPNFVFILADDLGWADTGCYGNKFIETPNIDRLAAQGMRFTDAYAAAPVCSPTRASIMTGRYPVRSGVYDFIRGHRRPYAKLVPPPNARAMPLEDVTLAEALRQAGYVSGIFGKWHLGHSPKEQGFVAGVRGRDKKPAAPEGYARKLTDFARSNKAKGVGPLTEQAIRFIEQNRDRPFLCFLSHQAVHIPCEAREELVAKYEAKAALHRAKIYPKYAAMTEALDESVGLVAEALDALRLTERTVVIFFSDNGGLDRVYHGKGPFITTNAPLRGVKGQLYEGGVREPLIVRWPGVVKSGSICHAPVISNDFLPTMLEIAGIRAKPEHVIDGESLVPLLKGGASLKRDALYWYYPAYHHSTPALAIREGDYKLIEFLEDGRLELYNLEDDIEEQRNLAEKMPEKAAKLRERLRRWCTSVGARLPAVNRYHDPEKAHIWGRRTPGKRKKR